MYLQLLTQGESAEIPLKLQWPAKDFNWTKKCLKPRYADDPDLLTFNALIERERGRYWDVIMEFLRAGRPFKLADVFKTVNLFSKGQTLSAFMSYAIPARMRTAEAEDKIKESTSRPHRVTITWLDEYTKNLDVPIAAINSEWLKRFANYLRKHMSDNSVWARIKDVKSYLEYARRQGFSVNNDYKLYKIKLEDTEPTWLDEHEIEALLGLYEQRILAPDVQRILKAFLYDCFTGLRISDLKRWDKSWIKGDFIEFYPTKGRVSQKRLKPVTIPIIPIARGFIDSLRTENFNLPTDQEFNRQLKFIAVKAGINKNLTSHVARHTFATWLAIDQVPVIVISKLLGHKGTKATMIYIHIADNFKAIQMMKMQRRFGVSGQKSLAFFCLFLSTFLFC